MSLREFTDQLGGEWRVWDNRPESVHPVLRESGYLRSYGGGWLVFESADGLTKLRLTPIPAGWTAPSIDDLREWLGRATHVRGTPIENMRIEAPRTADTGQRRRASDIA